jgi:hypothetical protein
MGLIAPCINDLNGTDKGLSGYYNLNKKYALYSFICMNQATEKKKEPLKYVKCLQGKCSALDCIRH